MAGGFGTTTANNILKLYLQAVAIANIADNAASSPATLLYLSLHTASPSGAGQDTNEIAYTSYARKSISRASGAGGFTVSGATGALTDALTSFAAGTGGSGTATHFGLGMASSGTGILIVWGTVTPNIVCGNGITPQLTSAVFLTLGT
jgi:hypothetical protein